MNLDTLKFSAHSKQRYAERIMNKDNKAEVNVFIQEHEDKIEKDITKMLQYGTLLYSGKPVSDIFDKRLVDVYQNGLWIIIVDKEKNNVITLYSIDLGVGDEMNDLYIGKLLNQLDEAKENYEKIKNEIASDTESYMDIVSQNETIIAEYRKTIKELEAYNDSIREVIKGLHTKDVQAEREVRDIVAKMIGRKIF